MSQFTFAFVALVAQWIARWIPNPKVRGSNPRWGIFFFSIIKMESRSKAKNNCQEWGSNPRTHMCTRA